MWLAKEGVQRDQPQEAEEGQCYLTSTSSKLYTSCQSGLVLADEGGYSALPPNRNQKQQNALGRSLG